MAHARREVLRQNSQSPAHLQHHIGRVELRRATDHSEDVVVDQEVLTELAVGAHPEAAQAAQARLARFAAHHPKTRAEFSSTVRSSSS